MEVLPIGSMSCQPMLAGVSNSLDMVTATASLDDAVLDTLVVIGGRIDPSMPATTLSRLVEASARCRRVASVCTGAFTLAAAGLLDGRRATTHWRYAARLQREYPSVKVEADRIFCRDGNVWTSAGITAGIDLALALIEEDHGFDVAKGVAQHLVVYHRRHGGQSQFAASLDLAPKNDRIAAALGYAPRSHRRGSQRRTVGRRGCHEPSAVQPRIPGADRHHTRARSRTDPRRPGQRPPRGNR